MENKVQKPQCYLYYLLKVRDLWQAHHLANDLGHDKNMDMTRKCRTFEIKCKDYE